MAIAVIWNGHSLFVSHSTHFVLIGACLAVLFDRQIDDKKPWKMVAGGVSVLAYVALIIIVSDPR